MLESRKSQDTDRFRCLIEPAVIKETPERFRCLIEPTTTTTIPTSPLHAPPRLEIPTTPSSTFYYSTKTTTPSSAAPTLSFEERFERTRREKLPASPLHLPQSQPQPRQRQNSALSLASEESFPSLPSGIKSTPTTPVLTAWSSVVQKHCEAEDSYRKPRVPSERAEWEKHWENEWHAAEEEEEEIVYDEDGFPQMR